MGVVWSGWVLPGQEAAFSPHAYFEHVQIKRSLVVANNERGKGRSGNTVYRTSSVV